LAFFALSGITFTLPFYLQIVRNFSTLNAGLAFVPFALGQIIAAPNSSKMVARFGNRNVMTFGLVLVGLALTGMTQLRENTPIWAALLAFVLFGAGMGSVIAPASTVMQNALPMGRAGSGSAVQNTVRQVFGALGVATLGTILATTYASNLAPALSSIPNIPDQAKEALRSTVSAVPNFLAKAQGQGLPADKAEAFRTQAFAAFTDASHKVATISATIVFLVAIIVVTQLPKNMGKAEVTEAPAAPVISE
jgi:MFS family permease